MPPLADRAQRRLSLAAALAMGVLGHLVVAGPRIVLPTNLGWLFSNPDSAMHYLGWAFFRNSPWSWPLGANASFGLEIGSSILYSDSVPALALFFKLLGPLLPEAFQYSGLWVLACFVLQAYFSWRLLGLVTTSFLVRAVGSGLFVFAPAMIWRLHGHEALVGHWMLLAALDLALRSHSRPRSWALLAAGGALVHTYHLAVILVLWFASFLSHLALRTRSWRHLGFEAVLVVGVTAVALWQAGFFLVHGGKGIEGFGFFRMNLLSPIDSSGWSHLLKDLPEREGDYEGFNFLGLGVLMTALMAAPVFLSAIARREVLLRREHRFLAAALLLLFVYALSNHVGIGTANFDYPFPKIFRFMTRFLRGSGRVFWVVGYALELGCIGMLASRYRPKVAALVLAGAVGIQAWDTEPGWRSIHTRMASRSYAPPSPISDPLWGEMAARYRTLRVIPPGNFPENWIPLASFAVRHHLATDAAYLARVDPARLSRLQEAAKGVLEEGLFEPGTLYVLQAGAADKVAGRVRKDRDLLRKVDGFWVLAPGWYDDRGKPVLQVIH
jgi:hypothetical protein